MGTFLTRDGLRLTWHELGADEAEPPIIAPEFRDALIDVLR